MILNISMLFNLSLLINVGGFVPEGFCPRGVLSKVVFFVPGGGGVVRMPRGSDGQLPTRRVGHGTRSWRSQKYADAMGRPTYCVELQNWAG